MVETESEDNIAVRHNIDKFKEIISRCRQGNYQMIDGLNMWVHADIAMDYGASWEDLDSSAEEVKSFLIQDILDHLAYIRDGRDDVEGMLLGLIQIEVYFGGDEDSFARWGDVLAEAGINVDQIYQAEHVYVLRQHQAELERCRQQGPSRAFYGLDNDLSRGEISLEELGATAEEIAHYRAQYTM